MPKQQHPKNIPNKQMHNFRARIVVANLIHPFITAEQSSAEEPVSFSNLTCKVKGAGLNSLIMVVECTGLTPRVFSSKFKVQLIQLLKTVLTGPNLALCRAQGRIWWQWFTPSLTRSQSPYIYTARFSNPDSPEFQASSQYMQSQALHKIRAIWRTNYKTWD